MKTAIATRLVPLLDWHADNYEREEINAAVVEPCRNVDLTKEANGYLPFDDTPLLIDPKAIVRNGKGYSVYGLFQINPDKPNDEPLMVAWWTCSAEWDGVKLPSPNADITAGRLCGLSEPIPESYLDEAIDEEIGEGGAEMLAAARAYLDEVTIHVW